MNDFLRQGFGEMQKESARFEEKHAKVEQEIKDLKERMKRKREEDWPRVKCTGAEVVLGEAGELPAVTLHLGEVPIEFEGRDEKGDKVYKWETEVEIKLSLINRIKMWWFFRSLWIPGTMMPWRDLPKWWENRRND